MDEPILLEYVSRIKGNVNYKQQRVDVCSRKSQKTHQQLMEIDSGYEACYAVEKELVSLSCTRYPEVVNHLNNERSNGKVIIYYYKTDYPSELIASVLGRNAIEYDHIVTSESLEGIERDIEAYSEGKKITIISSTRGMKFIQNASYSYLPIIDYGKTSINNSGYFSCIREKGETPLTQLNQFLIMVLENSKKIDYWYQFGYKYYGHLFYCFSDWLMRQFKEKRISTIYFGQNLRLMVDIFKRIYPDYDVRFIPFSEEELLLSSIKDYDGGAVFLKGRYADSQKGLTYREYAKKLSFLPDKALKEYESTFDSSKVISGQEEENVAEFLKKYESDLLAYFSSIRRKVSSFFRRASIEKIAVVDTCDEGVYYSFVSSELSNTCNVVPFVFFSFSALGNYMINSSKDLPCSSKLNQILLDLMASNGTQYFASNSTQSNSIIAPVEGYSVSGRLSAGNGILDYICDYLEYTRFGPMAPSYQVASSVFDYFSRCPSRLDLNQLMKINYFTGYDDSQICPICRSGVVNIGIVNPWPGDMSAESEVLSRFRIAMDNMGYELTLLDNFGFVLDKETQKRTEQIVDPNILDFVISTHFDTPKSVDAFYYHTLWNPPEIPSNLEEFPGRIANNYISYDDYLIYDSGGMSDHLKTMLLNKPRNLEGASELVASFPQSVILQPNLDSPKLFYCGMNWEVLSGKGSRHEGLFKRLDETDCVMFFGPDKNPAWGDVRPWEGYNCYKGPIPFDGTSILKYVNQCGICLVLSSDIHRRAGAATNRLYEACAAGAVIISDNNEFVMKNFRDAALFIEYNKNNPDDTFNQIMDAYKWVLDNKDKALEMAKRAQEIFIKKYSLECQIKKLLNNHSSRIDCVSKDLFADDADKTVLVTFVVNSLDPNTARLYLSSVIENCDKQNYGNIVLGVVVDKRIYPEINSYLYKNSPRSICVSCDIFNFKKIRVMTDGQAIRLLQKTIPHDYYVNTNASEIWYYDHISTLIHSIEFDNSIGSYSARSIFHADGYIRPERFDVYNMDDLNRMADGYAFDCPGHFMFKVEAHKLLPDYIFSNIDGLEQYFYASILTINYGFELSFTRRMTFVKHHRAYDVRNSVVSTPMQIRIMRDLIRFNLRSRENTIVMNYAASPPGDSNTRTLHHLLRHFKEKANRTLFKIRG